MCRYTNSTLWKRWLLWKKWTLKKVRILISKTAMVRCCKLFLYANGFVMSMRVIFGDDWNDVPCKITFLISGNDVISLESRPLNFHGFIQAYSMRPHTYLRLSLIRVLNQFRNKSKVNILKNTWRQWSWK